MKKAIIAATVLTAAIGFAMAQTPAQIKLSWNAPTTKEDGTPLTGALTYRLYSRTGNNSYVLARETDQTEVVVTEPTERTSYYVTALGNRQRVNAI